MRRSCRIPFLLAVSLLVFVVELAAARAALTVDWSTIACGGTNSASGGEFTLSSTIGQHDAGVMSGGGYTLSGGFWVAGAAGPPESCGCGDLNGSGLVDLNDFIAFQTCFGLSAPTLDCVADLFFCADLNGSGTVDLNDFIAFSTAFGLPPQGSPPNCE